MPMRYGFTQRVVPEHMADYREHVEREAVYETGRHIVEKLADDEPMVVRIKRNWQPVPAQAPWEPRMVEFRVDLELRPVPRMDVREYQMPAFELKRIPKSEPPRKPMMDRLIGWLEGLQMAHERTHS